MSRRLRVLVLMDEQLVPPVSLEGVSEEEIQEWKTEYDVCAALTNLGHEVQQLGVGDDLGVIRHALLAWRPHVVFNLMEQFHGIAVYDQHVASYLELMRQPYTGCNPRGLMLAHDKALCKKILIYHRIPTPRFHVFPMNKKVRRPKLLKYPMLVKSVSEEASAGITLDSLVCDDEALRTRVSQIHAELQTDALVEEFVEGREFYVGVIGNRRLQTFPVWEMFFRKPPEDFPNIATARVKWDLAYQQEIGVETGPARDLSESLERAIKKVCKRVYRALDLSGYARMDLRMDANGSIYVLEANPNPNLAYGEDFAESAEKVGIAYEQLVQRIVNLGMAYQPEWRVTMG